LIKTKDIQSFTVKRSVATKDSSKSCCRQPKNQTAYKSIKTKSSNAALTGP